jgi:hypothetical protein
VVLFGGCEPELNSSWWLHDYFPATRRLVFARTYPPGRIAEVLGPVALIPVPIPADCVDGFEAAYWRRPAALLDPAVWAATSALALISEGGRAEIVHGVVGVRAEKILHAPARAWMIIAPWGPRPRQDPPCTGPWRTSS